MKHDFLVAHAAGVHTFNRTELELKLEVMAKEQREKGTFNRTELELKPYERYMAQEGGQTSIAPNWN